MNILVTGSRGFIGKNLIAELRNKGYNDIFEFDKDTNISQLDIFIENCDFVFHLAGVNRPTDEKEYMEGNYGFTDTLLNKLKKCNNSIPILVASSIQAELDNLYGKSKKACEETVLKYGNETGSKTMIYRLPNVFGKWCIPNYNSVVATFCHNIANGLDIIVNDETKIMNLVYIDDVINEFIDALENNESRTDNYCTISSVHTVTLGTIVALIKSFKESRNNLSVPNMGNEFEKKLYSTYLSYLPQNDFIYPLHMHSDNRGSFTEFIRTPERGQISINTIKPGITKGNHWHNTKNEKFLVVKGMGLIQLRKVGSSEIINHHVTGERLEVVDIPTGYTHNIINRGDTDLVTVMWANEVFNPNKPDTYYLEV